MTFSPDGDGRNDAVRIVASGTPGGRLELRITDLPTGAETRMRPVTVGEDGTVELVWDGSGGRKAMEVSAVVQVCVADGGPCAPRPVLAHRRVLSAWVDDLGSFAPGAKAPVRVETDRAGPVRLEVVPAHDVRSTTSWGAVDVTGAGAWSYVVPEVPRAGHYVLRVSSGRVRRYLPLVIRAPRPLGKPAPGTPLVVYPVLTWRAYDKADTDRDGRPDSWYRHPEDPQVPRTGPFESGTSYPLLMGSEPAADLLRPVSRLLAEEGLAAQHVTDVDLAAMTPAQLARYPVVVFAGHEEYYELATYELVRGYLASGGRALYLQANAFYGEAAFEGDSIVRRSYRFRTPERSDFALAANGFRVCCWPEETTVRYRVAKGAPKALPWLFRGTGLGAGDPLGVATGEVDATDPALSPPGTVVVAAGVVPRHREEGDDGVEPAAWIGTQRIPYEPAGLQDQQVEIAYARLDGGGEIFSWGNVGFAQSLYAKRVAADERRAMRRMLLNVWRRFSR